MKKIFIPVALAAVVAMSVVSSCKKKTDDPTRAEMMVGTWKTNEQGVDSNQNGAWDNSEREAIPAAEQGTFTFNSDGSGTISGDLSGSGTPITLPITWNLRNSDNDLRVIMNFLGQKDTSDISISSITSSDLILVDKTSVPADYLGLKKQ